MSVNEAYSTTKELPDIDVNYVFKNRPEEYKVNLKPMNEAVKQYKVLINKLHPDIDNKTVDRYVLRALKEHGVENPVVKYKKKNRHGDMEIDYIPLTTYIDSTVEAGEVMVPSFTTYVHPSRKKSLHATFLEDNIAKRKVDKKLAFKYEQEGNPELQSFYETRQKIRKIMNNSLSGAYGSKSTILYNPSAHYTLTSMTRSVASIGNMTSESMVAGNKYFKDPEVTINYILAIISNIPSVALAKTIIKHNLHIPTPEEVFDTILYSSRHYWTDIEKEDTIFRLIESLTDVERCAVVYCNDFWHFMKYNDNIARDIVGKMSARLEEGSDDPYTDLVTAPEGICNLVHHICKDDIKGLDIDYEKLKGTKLLKVLGSTAKGIINTLKEYQHLFKYFYTTDIMPTSVAYIKDMLRDTIVLSDTDSTCGSYDKWVEWFFGEPNFEAPGAGVSAAVMTINTQVMDHHIKIFARNMNIDTSLVELLKMKNEFYWPIFVATNVSKHYFADVEIQEGNVKSDTKLELKGVHLIASSIRPDIAKFCHDIMRDVMKNIRTKHKISIRDYVNKTIEKELEIIDDINKGDVTVYKTEYIKDASSYKDPRDCPYKYLELWNDIFGRKYGDAGKPTIQVIKVQLDIKNKTDINYFLSTIKDPYIKDKFTKFLSTKKDNKLNIFRVPVNIADEKGIPSELVPFINTNKIVEENLKALYYVLESIGFYRKNDLLLCETVERDYETVERNAA